MGVITVCYAAFNYLAYLYSFDVCVDHYAHFDCISRLTFLQQVYGSIPGSIDSSRVAHLAAQRGRR